MSSCSKGLSGVKREEYPSKTRLSVNDDLHISRVIAQPVSYREFVSEMSSVK